MLLSFQKENLEKNEHGLLCVIKHFFPTSMDLLPSTCEFLSQGISRVTSLHTNRHLLHGYD
jgi:hypothetical protein